MAEDLMHQLLQGQARIEATIGSMDKQLSQLHHAHEKHDERLRGVEMRTSLVGGVAGGVVAFAVAIAKEKLGV